MFCFQCQETAKGTGCTIKGVCGKTEEVAKLQDLLLYTIKGISDLVVKGNLKVKELGKINCEILDSLFITITNANFDDAAIEKEIKKMLVMRDELRRKVSANNLHDAATFKVQSRESMLEKASSIGVLATENEDIRSLRGLVTYGVKGLAAYTAHAFNIGKENDKLYIFVYEALAATLDDRLTVDELVALTLKTGQYGVTAMALLDEANTSRYGNPQFTTVNVGVRNNPAILISGHDLTDLEQLLEQTQGTGVDVYTHGEMLPAHY
jgi:hydroxylamine reductase